MIRGKCHTFCDLCFVKVRQWGSACVERVPAISQNSPGGAPRELCSGTKTACVALCMCVCACLSECVYRCVCCVWGRVLKTELSLNSACRMTGLFNDKNTIMRMTNNGSVRASELKQLKLKTSIYAWMPPLRWSYYVCASKHPLCHLSSQSSLCPPFSLLLALIWEHHEAPYSLWYGKLQ